MGRLEPLDSLHVPLWGRHTKQIPIVWLTAPQVRRQVLWGEWQRRNKHRETFLNVLFQTWHRLQDLDTVCEDFTEMRARFHILSANTMAYHGDNKIFHMKTDDYFDQSQTPIEVKLKVILWPTISRHVCPSVRARDQFSFSLTFSLDSFMFIIQCVLQVMFPSACSFIVLVFTVSPHVSAYMV
jgi:hypothetical protein